MKAENIIKMVVVSIDGKEKRTVASCLNNEGEIVRGKARCLEGDEFKPEIGAIIALCKAMGVAPAKACYDVMDVYAKKSAIAVEKAKAKEMDEKVQHTKAKVRVKGKVKPVKIVKVSQEDLKGMQVGKVKRGRCVLKGAGALADSCPGGYGVMGTQTRFCDRNGDRLYVGDLVTVDIHQGDVRTGRHWKAIPGLTFVVDEQSDNPASKGQYIMGMLSACNDRTGKIDAKLKVKRVKSWREVEIGEVNSNGMIKVVWEDEND